VASSGNEGIPDNNNTPLAGRQNTFPSNQQQQPQPQQFQQGQNQGQAPTMEMMWQFMMQTQQQQNVLMQQQQQQNALMQQLLTNQNDQINDISNDKAVKAAISQFREDAKLRLTDRCRVTLTGTNYDSWRMAIMSDADLIDAIDIFARDERNPPEEFTPLQKEIWKKKNDILRARIIQSFSHTVREQLGIIEESTAAGLFEQVSIEYGKSFAEERLLNTKELINLKVENNDYLSYMRKFRVIRTKYTSLGFPLDENFLHDCFILGLGNWQSQFVKTKLDEFFSGGRGETKNLNLDALMEQLASRASTATRRAKTDSSDSPKSNSANKMSSQIGENTKDGKKKQSKDERNSTTGHKLRCHKCSKMGHRAKDCTEFNQSRFSENRKTRKGPLRMEEEDDEENDGREMVVYESPSANPVICAEATTVPPNTWLVDSCASYHFTPSRSSYASYRKVDKKEITSEDIFTDANGNPSYHVGIGTVVLQAGEGTLVLKDVRHTPGLSCNLISVGLLKKQGFTIGMSEIDPSPFRITDTEGSTFEANLHEKHNIYLLDNCTATSRSDTKIVYATVKSYPNMNNSAEDIEEIEVKKVVPQTMTMMQWHRRLGHLNKADILRMARDPGSGVKISGIKDLPFCKICVKAKQTRRYSKTPRIRSVRPLERIHIDIAGGGKTLEFESTIDEKELDPSRLGAKYVMGITDDATRFRWPFFLKKRSDAIQALKFFYKFIKNRGFKPPAYVHSDNEFKSKKIQQFFNDEGTQWEPTAPHSPWQDGVSEATFKIIFRRARAVMLDSELPQEFWADAVESMTQLTNAMPTSVPLYNSDVPGGVSANPEIEPSQHRTPLSAWMNIPSDVTPYYRWGSKVHVHLHGSEKPKTKIDAKSKECHVIGYIGTKIYRVWDPKKNKVFTTSDVEFEDSKPVNDPAISIDKNPTPIPTDPTPPANHSEPTRSLATTSDEVEDMDDVARIDEAHPGAPADRRADRRVVELDLGGVDLRRVGGDRRLELRHLRQLRVDALPARILALAEILEAREVELGIGEQRLVLRLLGDRLIELRLVDHRIDLAENIALFDVLPFGEVDRDQFAVDLRANQNIVQRTNRTDAFEIDRHVLNARRRRQYGHGEIGPGPVGGLLLLLAVCLTLSSSCSKNTLVIGTWILLAKRWRIVAEARLFTGLILFLVIAAPWQLATRSRRLLLSGR